jgi:hypothetical protein
MMRDSCHLTVAAIVGRETNASDPTDLRTYAHDPECDVDAGGSAEREFPIVRRGARTW